MTTKTATSAKKTSTKKTSKKVSKGKPAYATGINVEKLTKLFDRCRGMKWADSAARVLGETLAEYFFYAWQADANDDPKKADMGFAGIAAIIGELNHLLAGELAGRPAR